MLNKDVFVLTPLWNIEIKDLKEIWTAYKNINIKLS